MPEEAKGGFLAVRPDFTLKSNYYSLHIFASENYLPVNAFYIVLAYVFVLGNTPDFLYDNFLPSRIINLFA